MGGANFWFSCLLGIPENILVFFVFCFSANALIFVAVTFELQVVKVESLDILVTQQHVDNFLSKCNWLQFEYQPTTVQQTVVCKRNEPRVDRRSAV